MKRIPLLAFLTIVLSAPCAASAQKAADGTIVEVTPVTVKAFDEVKRLDRYTTSAEYATVLSDHSWTLERVTYLSDGLKVNALLYRPRATTTPLPAIVFNRGGYLAVETPEMWLPMFHRFAAAGFITIAPMLRESAGGEGRDEVGGDDVHDVLNCIAVLKSMKSVDSSNIFMDGESRGGMMTYQAIRDGVPIRAAATVGAFADFQALIENQPDTYRPLIAAIFPDYEKRKSEIQLRRSAVLFSDRLTVPILIMAGGADVGVIPAKALVLAGLLQEQKKPYEVHIFAGGKHTLSDRAAERDRLITEWFRRFMAKDQKPASS